MFKYDSRRDVYYEVDFKDFHSSSGSIQSADKLSYFSSLISINVVSRVIRKYGGINIFFKHRVQQNLQEYMKDFGYTLLTTKWKWIWLTVGIVNFATYILFSILWMWMAHVSGDFEPDNQYPCVVNTKTFTGYLLLSIETITSIGYGYRYPTENCRGGWILLTFQALCSVVVQGVLVSAIYVKISKPFTKVSNSLFSKTAVICLRDGQLCFIFRIHDFNSRIWCGTTISLYFIDKDGDCDGTFEIKQMKIKPYGLLIFPLEIEHVINEDSPLWGFNPEDIAKKHYEIVAVAEGSSMITGQVSQNRTSYINTDILWGYRFCPCVSYEENKGIFEVNYKQFKKTIPFDTPLCSAKKLKEIEFELTGMIQ